MASRRNSKLRPTCVLHVPKVKRLAEIKDRGNLLLSCLPVPLVNWKTRAAVANRERQGPHEVTRHLNGKLHAFPTLSRSRLLRVMWHRWPCYRVVRNVRCKKAHTKLSTEQGWLRGLVTGWSDITSRITNFFTNHRPRYGVVQTARTIMFLPEPVASVYYRLKSRCPTRAGPKSGS